MKLGSLFDGSGGFPLAGALFGIEPVWSSEIEPYPMRVTAKRFPNMKQLGDVTKINGAEIEPVDIITFGSPCQDLSIAGKQAGIHDGERSNLFFEAIRIIKEMRNATANKFPRFAIWENVPGSFSSNDGRDFLAVIKAFCSVCDERAYVPGPPEWSWQSAWSVLGDRFSIAWKVYDAQYWGVPQRRKRIYLIADFRSGRAGEILFKQRSVFRDLKKSRQAQKQSAKYINRGVKRSHTTRKRPAVSSDERIKPVCVMATSCYDAPITDGSISPTLCARAGTGGNQLPLIVFRISEQLKSNRKYYFRKITPTECARLQGFPDWWTDGVEGGDSAKYKMWGNGIALPCAVDVIGRIAKELKRTGGQHE